jgi:hypothetical protein
MPQGECGWLGGVRDRWPAAGDQPAVIATRLDHVFLACAIQPPGRQRADHCGQDIDLRHGAIELESRCLSALGYG